MQAFVVEADTSSVVTEAVLLQKNCETLDKEFLAIRNGIILKEWHHPLKETQHPLQVFNNYINVEHLCKAKVLKQRQLGWALSFTQFNFIISYHPGIRKLMPYPKRENITPIKKV